MIRLMLVRYVSMASLALPQACVHGRVGSSAKPVVELDAVRPDSVLVAPGAVVEVVLRGRGFAPGAPGRNTVMFGDYAINAVPANADGTEIRLVIPETLPSGGEAPPQPVMSGAYSIRVRALSGQSNAVVVRVVR